MLFNKTIKRPPRLESSWGDRGTFPRIQDQGIYDVKWIAQAYYCHDECENVRLKSHLRLAKHRSHLRFIISQPGGRIIIALIVTPSHIHWRAILLHNICCDCYKISVRSSARCDSPLPPARQCSLGLRSQAGDQGTQVRARCFPQSGRWGGQHQDQLSTPGQSDNPGDCRERRGADMKIGNCPMVVMSYGSDVTGVPGSHK